ncbi:MAG: ABC transporter ATP-binding protein [Legionellaceae bacterium]
MPKTKPNAQTVWQFLWTIIKPYRWWYVLMMQAPLLTAFYVLANNYSLKLLVDAFSVGSGIEYASLIFPISLFIGAQIGLEVVWRLSNFAGWKAEPLVHRKLLLTAYDYVQYHSYRYFQTMPTGTLVSKIKGLLEGYTTIFASVHHVMGKNLCAVIVSVGALFFIHTTVFFLMLGWCLLVVTLLYPMAKHLNELSNYVADKKHAVMGMFSDNITNIFSLFYFSKRQAESKRLHAFMSQQYVPSQQKLYQYDFKFNVTGSFLYWLMLIGLFLFMIYLRQHSDVSTGDFLFVMLTSITISFELWGFIMGLCDVMKQVGDFKSSYTILSTSHEVVDSPEAKDIEIKHGAIKFSHVSFAYDQGAPIFTDLNLSIQAGEKVGLIGHSGAGKSTLVSLLLKNFKPTSGHIEIDGVSLDGVKADSLRKQIALIPQDIMLFHRSIGDNIAYAKDNASWDEIKNAAKLANIDRFIEQLPEQYHTMVGERGVKLSGGQRQRIAIARAILKNAPIIILDEATSSLDSVTEQEIQQSLHLMLEKSKATVIAIAHRLSTIRHMDRIIVMEGGVVIEEGTFEQLMGQEHGYFKKLWDSQVNGMV